MLRILTLYFLASFFRTSSPSLCPDLCKCHDKEIMCSDNGFTYIPQIHSSASTAKHLGLAGNCITIFEPQEFLLYSNLSRLDLQFNLISCIHHGSFSSLAVLTELSLGNNRISLLERQAFLGLTNLIYLDLHGNQLRDIKLGTFDGLTHLRMLRLSGNALRCLPRGIFACLGSLETLYLENNHIRSVFRDTFKGLGHLHQLSLSGNILSCFPHSAFKLLPSLSDLHLNDNVIMQMKTRHFKSQVELKVLSLSKNMLSNIDPHTFDHLSKLELLRLNGNRILKIEKHTFCHCTHIREIDLSDNLISTIEDSAFVSLTHLRVLKLNRNRLSVFSPRAFEGSSQLSLFNLNENPWDCGCRILCLKRWLVSGTNRRLRVFVRCSQPETLRGQYLGAMSSALIQSNDRMCSDALPHGYCGTTAITSRTWLSEPKTVNIGDMQMYREEDTPVSKVIIKNAHKRDISESQQLQNQSGVILPNGSKTTVSIIPPRIPTSAKDITGNAACTYNHEVILNLSTWSVTSTSVVVEWGLARTDTYNVYFRVMYDQFGTRGRFSRFIDVKRGTVCNLFDLRPSTPYFVCVESVVEELVCHVASRDLCLGIITKAEELSGPEPQTIILYFSGINTLAVLTVLILLGYASFMIRRHWSSALSLVFPWNRRSTSCAMCAGIPMSDRNSGIQTNSSQTGTYQPNDVDAIDVPPAN